MLIRRGWVGLFMVLTCSAARGQEVTVKPEAHPSDSAAERLRPKGSDPYGPRKDWSTIPPWRQTSFYGVRAEGRVFIFVVDCSGSMADGDRLIRAKREIRRSVMKMQFPQRFQVIFYNDQPWPMPGGIPESADYQAKTRMIDWFPTIHPAGKTDPRAALALALGQKPDAVFLLSDGKYPDGTVAAILKKNPGKIPIHCIDLAGGAGGDDLKRIARASGGQYVSRP